MNLRKEQVSEQKYSLIYQSGLSDAWRLNIDAKTSKFFEFRIADYWIKRRNPDIEIQTYQAYFQMTKCEFRDIRKYC